MVYLFLANGFEEIEALAPLDILRRAEIEVVTVGIGDDVITSSHGVSIMCDTTDFDLPLNDDLQMIVLPGGMPGTLNLEASASVQTAIDYCVNTDKYVAAICAAPSILGHKGLLLGKTATCFPGFAEQLQGSHLTGAPVEVDGKFITGRGAGVSLEFGYRLVEILHSKQEADRLRRAMCCGA